MHIYDIKNLPLDNDLPTRVNGRVILPFCEGLTFTKLRILKVT